MIPIDKKLWKKRKNILVGKKSNDYYSDIPPATYTFPEWPCPKCGNKTLSPHKKPVIRISPASQEHYRIYSEEEKLYCLFICFLYCKSKSCDLTFRS